MSKQVMRIERFKAGSLKNIGNELERTEGVEHRNSDIDVSRRNLNHVYVLSEKGFFMKFKEILDKTNCTFNGRADQTAFEGMIITSDTTFFESLGWERGKPAPKEVEEFFDRAYQWALSEIGYNGTDVNIIGAQVHYDEKTPHLQLYYIPMVNHWQEKVYEKDNDGKITKNKNGSPIQARDERGRTITKTISSPEAPKLSRSDFWAERGGKTSYREMQDRFYDTFTKGYGYNLERGEIGSDRKHKTKNQYEAEQLKARREKEMQAAKEAETQKEQNKNESIVIHYNLVQEKINMSRIQNENKTLSQVNVSIKTENEELYKESERLFAKVEELKKVITMYSGKKVEIEDEIRALMKSFKDQNEKLIKDKNELLSQKANLEKEIGKLKEKKVKITTQVDDEEEKLTQLINIPPHPPMPSPLPTYEEWCENHELQMYISHRISKRKREEQQEELRKEEYEKEVEEYEEALAACRNWIAEWEYAAIAKKAIKERDNKEATIQHYIEEYSKLIKQFQILRDKHAEEIKELKKRHEEELAEKEKDNIYLKNKIESLVSLIDEEIEIRNDRFLNR